MYRSTTLIIIVYLLLSSSNVWAQDTAYVRKYGNLFSLKAFGYNDGFTFQEHGSGLMYIPDLHSGIGVGVWCKYFPFDICYRKEVDIFGREDYHRLKTTDMQLRGYNKYFAGDIYIQNYNGFYENVKNRFQITPVIFGDLPYNPDLSIFQFDMVGKYIFNHERFSYKAGFMANERQVQSAGSFTVGAALYYLKIQSDSLLISRDVTNMESCNIGINGGYAYNYVFAKHSTLFGSLSLGLNSSNSLFCHKNRGGAILLPVVHMKGAYWFNYTKWSFGATATYNIIHHSLDSKVNVYLHTRRLEALVVRRIWTSVDKVPSL